MTLAASLLLAAALMIALPAQAQSDAPADGLRDFCAQRPGKATPPCIVDAGHLQIEMGLADAVFQHSGGVHEDTYTLAATDLRLGVSRRIELEASWTPVVIDEPAGSRTPAVRATPALPSSPP
jgi:hypothetical protein